MKLTIRAKFVQEFTLPRSEAEKLLGQLVALGPKANASQLQARVILQNRLSLPGVRQVTLRVTKRICKRAASMPRK